MDSIVVAIDVLRATSTICTAFQNGARRLIPIDNIEEARKYKSEGFIVGAERGGEIVEGFDIGNSPFSFMGKEIEGKTVVFTTSNGTRAIAAARKAYKVVIASFLNFDAICNWLTRQNRDVILLCAGWKDKFNLEDTLLAGAITTELLQTHKNADINDSAIAAQHLYSLAKDDMYTFLGGSSHRKRLRRLDLEKDIKYCLTPNQTDVIPILTGDYLVNLEDAD